MSDLISLLHPAPAMTAPLPASRFHAVTLAVAVIAALATYATLGATLPAWAMFLGWVAYSTVGPGLREGLSNLACFLLGIVLGALTALAISALTPLLGDAATPVAVLGDVVIVLSLRSGRTVNNPLAYFLGLISFFAAAQAPSLPLLAMLASAGTIGAAGAATAAWMQGRVERPAA